MLDSKGILTIDAKQGRKNRLPNNWKEVVILSP
jgi:hypothetical protein